MAPYAHDHVPLGIKFTGVRSLTRGVYRRSASPPQSSDPFPDTVWMMPLSAGIYTSGGRQISRCVSSGGTLYMGPGDKESSSWKVGGYFGVFAVVMLNLSVPGMAVVRHRLMTVAAFRRM